MEEVLIENNHVKLVLTQKSDLSFVIASESDDENIDFVSQWSIDEHQEALSDKDVLHLVVKNTKNKSVGYVIICGLMNSNDSIELMRIVVTEKGKGYGSEILKLVKKWSFEIQNAHRLWLDVVEYNIRAQKLYKSQNFVCEGVLRECDKYEGTYNSLIIMSILKREYLSQGES